MSQRETVETTDVEAEYEIESPSLPELLAENWYYWLGGFAAAALAFLAAAKHLTASPFDQFLFGALAAALLLAGVSRTAYRNEAG